MNKPNDLVRRIKMALALVLLATVTGCAGYVDEGDYYDEGYYDNGYYDDWGPDMYFFGGGYYRDHGRDMYRYGQRGAESRGAAHLGGGGGGGHFGGGGHGGGGGGHGR